MSCNGCNPLGPGSGGGAVTSVFGRIGAVVAALNDYAASLVDNDSGVAGATVADALNTLASALVTLSGQLAGIQFPEVVEVPGPTLNATRAAHAGKRLWCTDPAGCVITVDAGEFSPFDWFDVIQGAIGQVSFAGTQTLDPPASFDPITAEAGAGITVLILPSAAGSLFGLLELS